MNANVLWGLAGGLALAGCASAPRAPTSTTRSPSAPALSVFARVPAQVGLFKLTERSALTGMPADSIFRFSDGSKTNLSVIIYAVNRDVYASTDPDTQKWTMREGEVFKEAQAIQQQRGRIASYVLAFSDTTRFTAGPRTLLEHRIGMPTRYPNGAITVEMQFLYLIDDKFVKVRATIPQQGWQQTRVPSFARELALRMVGGA